LDFRRTHKAIEPEASPATGVPKLMKTVRKKTVWVNVGWCFFGVWRGLVLDGIGDVLN